nr:glycosyltransferase family 4 protein [Gemmatimonadota bacterium]
MRIALSSASKQWAGEEMLTCTLARGFLGRGHDVLVFCAPGSPIWKELRNELPVEPVLRGFDLNPVVLAQIFLALRRHRTQAVFANKGKDLRFTGLVARLLGIPVIRRWELDLPLPNDRPHHRLIYGSIPTRQVAVSESVRQSMLTSAPWLRADRVEVIYNGIDFARFSAGEEAEFALPRDALAVGFVGRMEERKGIFDLATAWASVSAEHAEAHLVVVGRGESEAEFRSRLAAAPRVRWLGFREDVPAIMRALDLLVVPSHYEGFGLV